MKFNVVTIAVFSFLLTVGSLSMKAQTSEDETAIRAIYKGIAEGWNAGSGAGFAADFMPESDFIVWNGFYFPESSQETLTSSHDQLFKEHYPNTDMHYVVDKVRFVRPDVALVHTLASIVHDDEPMPVNPQVLFSTVVVKEAGEWKIISFHNLDLEVFQDDEQLKMAPMPPSVMYRSWYAAANQ